MTLSIVLLIVSLGLILLASVIFTNAIEILGHRLKMHQGAIGSILAAVGTALPETVIPIIAIFAYSKADAHQVGVGAIAGAPFMLATLAFFVTGAAVLFYKAAGRRTLHMKADLPTLRRDLIFFLVLYGLAIAAALLHDYHWVRVVTALVLLLSYGLYIRRTMMADGLAAEEVDPLYLGRLLRKHAGLGLIWLQVVASLALMIYSAHLFVGCVTSVAAGWGVSAMILSIIITPIATELPEKCNSVVWIGRRKDVLALGNITGAMVFQSSFPVAFGVIFTEWNLHGVPMVSALLAFASAALLLAWVLIRKSVNPFILLSGGLFYLAFIAYLVFLR